MNAKKSLENRIRGWFPKEPNLTKPIQHYAQPTTVNQKNITTDIDAIKQRTLFLIFLPFAILIVFLAFGSMVRDFHISWQVEAIGIILGLVAG